MKLYLTKENIKEYTVNYTRTSLCLIERTLKHTRLSVFITDDRLIKKIYKKFNLKKHINVLTIVGYKLVELKLYPLSCEMDCRTGFCNFVLGRNDETNN